MSVHGGKFGIVNGISSVRQWTIQDQISLLKAVNSATKGASARRKGIRSWNGSYNAYGGLPSVMPGESFTFAGYTAPNDDVLASDGVKYSGTAFVDSVAITWNFQTGDILSHVTNFTGHLALTVASAAVITDATSPDLQETCGLKIQYDPLSGTFVDWGNVTQVTLTISAANQKYVNSSTNLSGICWTGVKAGVLDWTLSVGEQENIRTLFALGDNLKLKLFTTASLFWELWYGMVKEATGITVDIESGAILARTTNLEMNGYGPAVGKIVKPGASAFWTG